MADLHKDLVKVVEDYLGPASERFVDRHIANHLKKSPDNLSAEDIIRLVEWIRISIAVLASDYKVAEEAAQRIKQLASKVA